ncbi:signal peptidase I, partial [Agromyces humi]|uniref:signal peptidase I n=1 Tax=Agromyces humi TaxID=1766800 RepID=UPI001357D958
MIVTLALAAFLPRPFGFEGTTVLSGSMRPAIQPGDIALVQPLDRYERGQVILFPNPAHPEQRLLHRIVDIGPDGDLVTKGDANEVADSTPVDPESVIGVGRVLVPSIGLPIAWASAGWWLLVIAAVVLGAALIRGSLAIEYFPRMRKGPLGRLVLESSATIGSLVLAVVVVILGVDRGSYAAFAGRTTTAGAWTMAGSDGPSTCAVTRWTYNTWPGAGIANFWVQNRGGAGVPGMWTLQWRFVDDQQLTSASLAFDWEQVGQDVTYVAWDWASIPVGEEEQGQVQVATASSSYGIPVEFRLNGVPCDYVPATAGAPGAGETAEVVEVSSNVMSMSSSEFVTLTAPRRPFSFSSETMMSS